MILERKIDYSFNLFTQKQTIYKYYHEYEEKLYWILYYIDFKRTYGTIHQNQLCLNFQKCRLYRMIL